jgi:hypothetical protein
VDRSATGKITQERRFPLKRTFLTLAAAFLLLAQRGRFQEPDDDEKLAPPRNAEFHFLRLEYTDLPQYHRRWGYTSRDGLGTGWWLVDWPAADNHFTYGIERLTRIDIGDPRHLRLLDDKIFDYPWIYATQTGWWNLSDKETDRLREYLLRGGFLMTDDFWGPGREQWDVFAETMNRVFPGKQIAEIDESDSSMHVLYDIREKDRTFIPGSRHLRGGHVVQPAGTNPEWHALNDDRGRMVVAINYNTDIGDAWEFADVPYYPEQMTALAYRYGINYIIYAMSH